MMKKRAAGISLTALLVLPFWSQSEALPGEQQERHEKIEQAARNLKHREVRVRREAVEALASLKAKEHLLEIAADRDGSAYCHEGEGRPLVVDAYARSFRPQQ